MYEIIKLIGRGANGDVFLAKNTQDNSLQVIKRLRMRDISEKERETIQTQLRLLKQFKHVNIVPFRDSFIDPQGNLNIVMAYCEGGDMHNLIEEAEGKKFEEKKIVDWIVQIALSIFYLHERRILHRDIKTQNIFLTNGKVMLGDFGVSKVLDQAADLARTNIGTPYYMSPEQYRQKPYSYKSDIWAFGCIIYEMCNHKHVFQALSLNALAVKVMKGIYAPVSQQYSRELRTLVDEMLSQNPKNRPSIIQILTRPFLFGKVQNYMKKIYNQEKQKYQPEMIKSLTLQAKALGFSLQQVKVKSNDKSTEGTPAKLNKADKHEKSKEKLKQQRQKKYEELRQKLQKQIQQRNRAQEKLKQMSKKSKQKNKPAVSKYSFQKPKVKKDQGMTDRSNKSKTKIDDVSVTEALEEKNNAKYKEEGVAKNFKMQEQYDMDYEEYSDKDENENNKIYEVDEEEAEEKEQQKPSEKKSSKSTTTQQSEISNKKPETPKPQQQKPQPKPPAVEDESTKVDKLQKQVKQKTIMITNIRNQMSKLDFVISSDSEQSQKQEKTYNPSYTRLNQKVNDLKQKVIAQIGRNNYFKFLKYVQENVHKAERNKVIEMVGQENIGVWQFAQNITKMEKLLSKIPMYA